MMEKTPWYPGDIKPVRKGWYERDYEAGDVYLDLWDGACWRKPNGDRMHAQDRQWRGLIRQGE
ncbi:hypothetical protein WI86_19540 [Burkholderia ubonensis]|nr:hypothetical protein WI86_19540 [Burkholderia ubonensis]